ncbi:MAG: nucleoside phosphorylase [Silvibacterium sp.]
MKRIAIVAALPGELKPLVRGWQTRGRNLWTGRIGEVEAIAIAGGMGGAAAERAAARVFAEAKPDVLVSYGWAGALTCAVKPPAACAISEVVDAGSGARYATGYAGGYRLITLDHVAHEDEKRGLAEKHQAVLVDMEAATVARMAAERGVAFYCFKGVSDGYNDRLPDFGRFMDGQGQLRMTAFVAYATVHPQYWPTLRRLGRNSGAAASALAVLAKEYLTQLQ